MFDYSDLPEITLEGNKKEKRKSLRLHIGFSEVKKCTYEMKKHMGGSCIRSLPGKGSGTTSLHKQETIFSV